MVQIKHFDENTLFQRFHSSEDNKEGHGLGLSIVKAICDYHRWIINYSFFVRETYIYGYVKE